MRFQKFLFWIFITAFAFGTQLSASIEITKAMLNGTVLQAEKYGTTMSVKFVPSTIQSFDGDIVFHFADNAPDDNEQFSYKLKNGKIIYYAHDGSKHRMTLLSMQRRTWSMLEEEDIDGDGDRFGFGQAVKITYSVLQSKSPKVKTQNSLYINNSSQKEAKEMIDQLYMHIYGRVDTRIASRRDYIDEINKFLHTASLLLIKKHKLDIKMQKIREHQMVAVGVSSEVIGLTNALSSIENLDGMEMRDFDGKKLNKLAELKLAYAKAIKTSTLYQKDNYKSEETREKEIIKLKDMLAYSGSTEDKNDMKDAEIKKLKGEYNYYKKLLDTPSIWCMRDKDSTQKKPLFYPKTFIIERLYQKYKAELDNSNKSYNPQELSRRAKELETISQKLKQSFNNNYLYELRTKPYSVKDLF